MALLLLLATNPTLPLRAWCWLLVNWPGGERGWCEGDAGSCRISRNLPSPAAPPTGAGLLPCPSAPGLSPDYAHVAHVGLGRKEPEAFRFRVQPGRVCPAQQVPGVSR